MLGLGSRALQVCHSDSGVPWVTFLKKIVLSTNLSFPLSNVPPSQRFVWRSHSTVSSCASLPFLYSAWEAPQGLPVDLDSISELCSEWIRNCSVPWCNCLSKRNQCHYHHILINANIKEIMPGEILFNLKANGTDSQKGVSLISKVNVLLFLDTISTILLIVHFLKKYWRTCNDFVCYTRHRVSSKFTS